MDRSITIQKLYNERRKATNEELDILFMKYVTKDIDQHLLSIINHFEKVRIIVLYTYVKNVIVQEKDKISVIRQLRTTMPVGQTCLYKYVKQAKRLKSLQENELSLYIA